MKTDQIFTDIANCVNKLPPDTIRGFLNRIAAYHMAPLNYQRNEVLAGIYSPDAKKTLGYLLDSWASNCADVNGQTISLMVQSAMKMRDEAYKAPELIWTGPDKHAGKFRRTDQALLSVINLARKELVIISFAAFYEQTLWDALKLAIQRGVHVSFFLEDNDDNSGFTGDISTAFSSHIFKKADFYHWAKDKRPSDGNASMHAKAAIADEKYVFISSANLTGNAMDKNIELGVVLEDPKIAKDICTLFREMIIDKTFEEYRL